MTAYGLSVTLCPSCIERTYFRVELEWGDGLDGISRVTIMAYVSSSDFECFVAEVTKIREAEKVIDHCHKVLGNVIILIRERHRR